MIITSCISFSYVVEQHHPEPTKYVGYKIEGEGLSKNRFLSVFLVVLYDAHIGTKPLSTIIFVRMMIYPF